MKWQDGLPQQSQQLLDPERLPQHREIAQSLREFLPSLLGIGGHDCHWLKWIIQVDRGHQLHAVFDLHARYETIISERECERAILSKERQAPIPKVCREDFEISGFQFFSQRRQQGIVATHYQNFPQMLTSVISHR
jgi:hypothetical protein